MSAGVDIDNKIGYTTTNPRNAKGRGDYGRTKENKRYDFGTKKRNRIKPGRILPAFRDSSPDGGRLGGRKENASGVYPETDQVPDRV